MEPEVLAEHQVVEFLKLRDRYVKWFEDCSDKKVNDVHASICIGQTRVMLQVFIADMNRILEQL